MELLDHLQAFFEGRIDFEGQKLSERVAQAGLTIVTVRRQNVSVNKGNPTQHNSLHVVACIASTRLWLF
jgi:hypothetical protein